MFNEIFFAGVASFSAHTAAALQPVFVERSAFDISQMRNGDNHVFVGIKVFRIEVAGRVFNNSFAGIVKTGLNVHSLVLDHLHLQGFAAQQRFQSAYLDHQLVVLALQFAAFQAGKLTQTHFHDGRSLRFREPELCLEPVPGLFHCLGRPNEFNHLVEYVKRLE